jgi:hypothetical protein
MSNLIIRSLHDVGAASWFGGSLMGALGLNGASNDVTDPHERAKVAAAGWARWSPVAALSIGAHVVGGIGLIAANRGRVLGQKGAARNTTVKTVLTLAAIASTAYSGVLGAKVAKGDDDHAEGGTKPSALTSPAVAKAQQQLRVLQWVNPILTGAIIVLGAEQGEQQKPSEILKGTAARALQRARS